MRQKMQWLAAAAFVLGATVLPAQTTCAMDRYGETSVNAGGFRIEVKDGGALFSCNDDKTFLKASGTVELTMLGGDEPILRAVRNGDIGKKEVYVDINLSGTTKTISSTAGGLGYDLYAAGIRRNELQTPEDIRLLSNQRWDLATDGTGNPVLTLHAVLFTAVFDGIHPLNNLGVFTPDFLDYLSDTVEKNDVVVDIPLKLTPWSISTVAGKQPVVGFNLGSVFGWDLVIPVGHPNVVFSQRGVESTAKITVSPMSIFGAPPRPRQLDEAAFYRMLSNGVGWKDIFEVTKHIAFEKADGTRLAEMIAAAKKVPGKFKGAAVSTAEKASIVGKKAKALAGKLKSGEKAFRIAGALFGTATQSNLTYDFLTQELAGTLALIDIGGYFKIPSETGDFWLSAGFLPYDGFPYLDSFGVQWRLGPPLTTETAQLIYTLEEAVWEIPEGVGIGLVQIGFDVDHLATLEYDIAHSRHVPLELKFRVNGELALTDGDDVLQSIAMLWPFYKWPLSVKGHFEIDISEGKHMTTLDIGGEFDALMFTLAGADVGFDTAGKFWADGKMDLTGGIDVVPSTLGLHGNFRPKCSGSCDKYTAPKEYVVDGSGTAAIQVPGYIPIFGNDRIGGARIGVSYHVGSETIDLSGSVRAQKCWHTWFGTKCIGKNVYVNASYDFKSHKVSSHAWTNAAPGDSGFRFGDRTLTRTTQARGRNEENRTVPFFVDGNLSGYTVTGLCRGDAYPRFSVRTPDGSVYRMGVTPTVPAEETTGEADTNATGVPQVFLYDRARHGTLFFDADAVPGRYIIVPEGNTTLAECNFTVTGDPAVAQISPVPEPERTVSGPADAPVAVTLDLEVRSRRAKVPLSVCALPLERRDLLHGIWAEELFGPFAPEAWDATVTDGGNFTLAPSDGTGPQYVPVPATQPQPDLAVRRPGGYRYDVSLSRARGLLAERMRRSACVRIGGITVDGNATQQAVFSMDGGVLLPGRYRLAVFQSDFGAAGVVPLPVTLDLYDARHALKPRIVEARGGDSNVTVSWDFDGNLSTVVKAVVYVEDPAMNGGEEGAYSFRVERPWSAGEPKTVTVSGLRAGTGYRFRAGVVTREGEIVRPSRLSDAVSATPLRGEGAPDVKVIDRQSYARFDENGDLHLRLRIFNEAEAPMREANVSLYFGEYNATQPLAVFPLALAAKSFKDIEAVIPFASVDAASHRSLEGFDGLVYLIDTASQNEAVMTDNFNEIAMEGLEYFLQRQRTGGVGRATVAVKLEPGYNLVANPVLGEDLADRSAFSSLRRWGLPAPVARRDLSAMTEGMRGGDAYFVETDKPAVIYMQGVPKTPDFTSMRPGWNLAGTGEALPRAAAAACTKVFVLRRQDGEAVWIPEPQTIRAGEGFWCYVKDEK